ncbi:hypothetical cyanophage protein [Synechococcus phage S-CRM01]|uniref:hypothetical cyanophage protein n=1 Tax=Synechococcus phage S-CRM01 TaxID=1026955 RepID=UPI000209E3D5|nr:hypothetical cyanophage protein [Synechococcus phage S-CRM01]AEC53078.1 hypothetical cyanophage protein [Synechococcus phage S-CRM01]
MAKDGKNVHLEHLEDDIINLGKDGGRKVIEVLKYMGQFLSGTGAPGVKVTTKWDGAPAVICGIDPRDGKFFVGTKGVFAKTPKLAKTQTEVNQLYSGGLNEKMTAALKYLPNVVKSGVLQGDLMFTNDKKKERIDGKEYITFRPNTITYAVEPHTPLGREIDGANLGIVFHTKYTGSDFESMQSSFSISDSDFSKSTEVWVEKAEFTDISGIAQLNPNEKRKYEAALRRAEGSLKQANRTLDLIQTGKKTLAIDTEFKIFFNKYVREGQAIPSVEKAYSDFLRHMALKFGQATEKLTTSSAQSKKVTDFMNMIEFIEKNHQGLKMVIASYMNIQYCKNILVNKMKKVSKLKLFADMGNGDYKATSPEGFVGIVNDKACKLVDRLEFARLNFTLEKKW